MAWFQAGKVHDEAPLKYLIPGVKHKDLIPGDGGVVPSNKSPTPKKRLLSKHLGCFFEDGRNPRVIFWAQANFLGLMGYGL